MIREVARRAGVALGTVSRVINGHPAVTPELRQRVENAIAELGYRPNRLARSLRSQQSYTFGLVIPDVTNPFFAELVKAIEQAASRVGYSIILGNAEESPEAERRYIQMLADRQVDGLMIVPSVGTRKIQLDRDVSVVLIDRALADHDVVSSDHRAGAVQAVEHLVGLGHRRIACIAGPQNLAVAKERYAGYCETMARSFPGSGVPEAGWTEFASFDYVTAKEAARRLLIATPRPTALFASSDQQAIGAMRAAADLGLVIPRDLSIVGFDDIPLSDLVSPRLTTVGQAVDELSALAVDSLIRLRRGETIAPLPRIPTVLTIRDSSGPCPTDGPARPRRKTLADRSDRNQIKGSIPR